jgi:hypothetical protein
MVYRFLLLSDETDNFKREIKISSQATFLDFHDEILKTTGFDQNQLYSFSICNDDWSIQTEVSQIEMDTSSEVDYYKMEDTLLEVLVDEERQKLRYVFDPLRERALYIELREIITGKELKAPICSKSIGNPPKQFLENKLTTTDSSTDFDEYFYGEDEYDEEELEELNKGSFDDELLDDFY